MVFEDLFYPDNPKKRQKFIDYQVKFRQSFKDFKGSWNELCKLFNNAVQEKKPDWKLRPLKYDQDSHSAEHIIGEIKKVLEHAKSKVSKIECDIGIKDLERAFKEMNPYVIKTITEALEATLGIVAIIVLITLGAIFYYLNPVAISISTVAGVVQGLIAFVIVGVALGAIVIAISGAINSKLLDDAIEVMKNFDENCIVHLDTARRKIDGINQNIKDGVYKIDDNHIIMNGKLIEINS